MNEVVPHPIDVRIHHQRVNEAKNQHHPQWRVWKQKVEPEKIREMEKPRRGWDRVPACMREELGTRARAFHSNCVSAHRDLKPRYSPQKLRFASLRIANL